MSCNMGGYNPTTQYDNSELATKKQKRNKTGYKTCCINEARLVRREKFRQAGDDNGINGK